MKYTLTDITNILFNKKELWYTIPDEVKEQYFFIINRYLSKIYPKQAQLLNDKSIDKIMSMDTWYAFLLNKPYPRDMWSKSNNKSEKDLFSTKEINSIKAEYGFTEDEIDLLIKYNLEEFKEEVKFLNQE